MTPSEIAHIGQALYGERWKSSLAERLGTSHKTVWTWATGKHKPSWQYYCALKRLAVTVYGRDGAQESVINAADLPQEATVGAGSRP